MLNSLFAFSLAGSGSQLFNAIAC